MIYRNHAEHCYTIKWNPSIYSSHPWGTKFWQLYIEVVFIEGLFCTCTNRSFGTWVPDRYTEVHAMAYIQEWPLRGVPL